jgi:hypothetical protein
MTLSAEEIRGGLNVLLTIHFRAIDVILAARRRDNKEISDKLGIHVTLVSRILSKAKDFEFVEKKEGKWIKTKEIRGHNLRRLVKVVNKKNISGSTVKRITRIYKKNYESIYIVEANRNTKTYVDIYIIENTLRKIIIDTFGSTKKWWKKEIVGKSVIEYAEKIRIAESNYPWIKKRGNHPIYYIGLGELRKIFTKQWDNYFKWVGNKEKFILWVDELVPIRNMIAHNVKLEREEINNAEAKTKWLLNLINSRKNKK